MSHKGYYHLSIIIYNYYMYIIKECNKERYYHVMFKISDVNLH